MQAAGGDAKEITLLVSNSGEGGQGMASPCRGGDSVDKPPALPRHTQGGI